MPRLASDTVLSLFCGALLLLTVRQLTAWITGHVDELDVVASLAMLAPLDAIAMARLAVSIMVAIVAAPVCVLPLVKLASRRGLDRVLSGAIFAAAMNVLIARSLQTNLLPAWFDFAVAFVLFASMTGATLFWWRR